MTKLKISVTIDSEITDWIEARGLNRSQFLDSAAREKIERFGETVSQPTPVATETFTEDDKIHLLEIFKKLGYDRYKYEAQSNRFHEDQLDLIIRFMEKDYSRKIDRLTIYKLLPAEYKELPIDINATTEKEMVASVLKFCQCTPRDFRSWGNHFNSGRMGAILNVAKNYYGLKLTEGQVYELLPDEYTRA